MDDSKFMRDMNNITEYAIGFLEGAQQGKPKLLANLGIEVKELLYQYIDSNARIDPSRLQHVYEWTQSGSPDARLYDLDYIVSGPGLSFSYTLSQSRRVKEGSKVPFYNKASIMENGIPVTIKTKGAQVLSFNDGGEQVFTRGPVKVNNPGGENAQGGLEDTIKEFFSRYLSQAFLDVSGIGFNLRNPTAFANNLSAGKRGGRSVGLRVGKEWISRSIV